MENSLAKTVAVIGLGRFGMALAKQLCKLEREVMAIDIDEAKVREIRNYTDNAFIIGALSREALEEAGVQDCGTAVVCIGEKIDTSVLTTLHVVGLGVPLVIAKANSPEHGQILEKIGAVVIYPETEVAVRLATRLARGNVQNYMALSSGAEMIEVRVPERLVGHAVRTFDIRRKYDLHIVAIENGGAFETEFAPDRAFAPGDSVIVIGSKENILEFENALTR